jgi:hypothetical protein
VAREEVEKHLHISILDPLKKKFKPLINFIKKSFLSTCIISGYKSPLGLMLEI